MLKYSDYTNALVDGNTISNKNINLYNSIFINATFQNNFLNIYFDGSEFTDVKFNTNKTSPVIFSDCVFNDVVPGPIYLISESTNIQPLPPVFISSYTSCKYSYISNNSSTSDINYYIIGPKLNFTNLTINPLKSTGVFKIGLSEDNDCQINNLTNCKFIDALLSNITFNSCDFSHTNFAGAILTNIIFNNCVLNNCIFTNCIINNCDFHSSTLYGIISGHTKINGELNYIRNNSTIESSILPINWLLVNGYLVGIGAYLGNGIFF